MICTLCLKHRLNNNQPRNMNLSNGISSMDWLAINIDRRRLQTMAKGKYKVFKNSGKSLRKAIRGARWTEQTHVRGLRQRNNDIKESNNGI